jgi:hypothetical protein
VEPTQCVPAALPALVKAVGASHSYRAMTVLRWNPEDGSRTDMSTADPQVGHGGVSKLLVAHRGLLQSALKQNLGATKAEFV